MQSWQVPGASGKGRSQNTAGRSPRRTATVGGSQGQAKSACADTWRSKLCWIQVSVDMWQSEGNAMAERITKDLPTPCLESPKISFVLAPGIRAGCGSFEGADERGLGKQRVSSASTCGNFLDMLGADGPQHSIRKCRGLATLFHGRSSSRKSSLHEFRSAN